MRYNRLRAILTGLLLFGGAGGAQAAYDLAQLQQIEKLVSSRNMAALRSYLSAHPEVMRGEEPLAQELTRFYFCAIGSGLDCFAAPPPRAPIPVVAVVPPPPPVLPPPYKLPPRTPPQGSHGGATSIY